MPSSQQQVPDNSIVIDKWAAQFTVFAFIQMSVFNMIIGFILFRVLDHYEIWPASAAPDHARKYLKIIRSLFYSLVAGGVLTLGGYLFK